MSVKKEQKIMKNFLFLILFLSACGGYEFEREKIFNHDFETQNEMWVSTGHINHPDIETIDYWIEETVYFWSKHFPDREECFWGIMPYTYAVFYDREFLIKNGQHFAGLSYGGSWRKIEISCCGYVKVRGVFIHELSHQITEFCFGSEIENENDIHHAFFEKLGLNEFTVY